MQSISERQAQILSPHPNHPSERMLAEILLGVEKRASRNIVTEGNSRLWDAIVADIANLPNGAMIDYDISAYAVISEYEDRD